MTLIDHIRFSGQSLTTSPVRALLILFTVAIGSASVILLASLSESARLFIIGQFNSLGSNLLIVLPGRAETTGNLPPLFGGTADKLTLEDAEVLSRSPLIRHVAPVVIGSAPVSYEQREREVTIIGSNREILPIRNLQLAQGRFLPQLHTHQTSAITVIGHQLKQELFGNQQALGQWLRINDRRYQVIGILMPLGESLGINVGEMAIVTVADAQALFNQDGLFRILVESRSREAIIRTEKFIEKTLTRRHHGVLDVTVITQQALLGSFDEIFTMLSKAVAGISSISLIVAGILIMNVMLVTVARRKQEIGLLKALGADNRQILWLFLLEAFLLAFSGSLVGMLIAIFTLQILQWSYPAFAIALSIWAVVAAISIAMLSGLLFGTLPARRAAALDPISALTGRIT